MNKRRPIHTTLKLSDISKIKQYGNGRLNTGIETILQIAESKQYRTKEQLLKIARKILSDYNEN